MSMSALVLLVAISLSAQLTDATSNGAGLTACDDMTMEPLGHYGNTAQISESPFGIGMSETSYSDGDTITVTLKGTKGFAGFLLAALRVDTDTSSTSMGNFEVVDAADADLAAATCGITHTREFSSLQSKRDEIKFKWTATEGTAGDFKFFATFVEKYDTFWVKVTTDETIYYMEPPSPRIDDYDCQVNKSCFHYCEGPGVCNEFILKWSNTSESAVTFELQGRIEDKDEDAYVALGLSTDDQMINATIIACIVDGGTPLLANLFAEGRFAPIKNPGDIVGDSIVEVSTSAKDGTRFITCQFSYDYIKAQEMLAGDKWKDLENSELFAFVARGQFNGEIEKHRYRPEMSGPIDFLSDTYGLHGNTSEGSRQVGVSYLLAAAMMVILLVRGNF